MVNTFLVILCLFNLSIADAKDQAANSDKEILENLQKTVDLYTKKQLPLTIHEKYYSKLNLKTPLCEKLNLTKMISSCTYIKCFNKVNDQSGASYSEVIVHGLNTSRNCAISHKSLRYFIPSKDLNTFSQIFEQMPDIHNKAATEFYSNSGKTNPISLVFSVPLQNKTCKVRAEYKIELDKSSVIVNKAPLDHKIVGIEKATVDKKRTAYYELDGVVYSPKYGSMFNFVPKLLNYSLAPESASICKGDTAALLFFDLEKKVLIEEISGL